MKTMQYNGRTVELTDILYRYEKEPELQCGVLVHDTEDKFHDGDAIYGNGWMIDSLESESDLETMLENETGSTDIEQNPDGTWHIES